MAEEAKAKLQAIHNLLLSGHDPQRVQLALRALEFASSADDKPVPYNAADLAIIAAQSLASGLSGLPREMWRDYMDAVTLHTQMLVDYLLQHPPVSAPDATVIRASPLQGDATVVKA